MSRFTLLLEKRKALQSNIFEEEELIQLSKNLSKEELDKIDPQLLTYSNNKRLGNIMEILDKMDDLISNR